MKMSRTVIQKSLKSSVAWAGCAVVCGTMAAQAGPPRYSIKVVQPDPPQIGEWAWVGGESINDSGLVLITAVDDFFFNNHAFLYFDGVFTDIDWNNFEPTELGNNGLVSGSRENTDHKFRALVRRADGSFAYVGTFGGEWDDESVANGINNVGQAVGWSTEDGIFLGYVWGEATGMQPLVSNEGSLWSATAINDAGKITGYETFGEAVLWDDGEIIPLGSFGTGGVDPYAINNADQIVGRYSVPDNKWRAFLWDAGTLTDLGDLGHESVYAREINDAGQIVGHAVVEGTTRHAVVWDDGAILDLNNQITPWSGWVLTTAHGINSQGQIAGGGRYLGEAAAFVLTPTCDGDIDGNRVVNTQDFLIFLNAWNMEMPVADWDGNGSVDTLDFLAFLGDWVAGC